MRAGKLRIEHLPVGADAGIADEAFFGISFGHILWQTQPIDRQWISEFVESLLSFGAPVKAGKEVVQVHYAWRR